MFSFFIAIPFVSYDDTTTIEHLGLLIITLNSIMSFKILKVTTPELCKLSYCNGPLFVETMNMSFIFRTLVICFICASDRGQSVCGLGADPRAHSDYALGLTNWGFGAQTCGQ